MQKQISTLAGTIIIVVAAVVLFGGVFTYQYFLKTNSSVTGKLAGQTYKNNQYGFEISIPNSWKGYSVVSETWTGHVINNYQQIYSGPKIIIKNPQTTPQQPWQDIAIMVFTHAVWNMVTGNNPTVAVSAAPIGPAKIGENSKYVFATPPRWYGFTDAIGWQEAVEIVKTFKSF